MLEVIICQDQALETSRQAVLDALAGWSGLLVDLMLRPFEWDRNRASDALGTSPDPGNAFMSNLGVGAGDTQITGFLTLLRDMLKIWGSRLVGYCPVLIEMTIGLTGAAQARTAGLEEDQMQENNVGEE